MVQALRRPEQILAYRPLRQILAGKPNAVWSVTPGDNVLAAMRLMADKNIGLVLVMNGKAITGVLSERDCVRRLLVAGKSPETTPVSDIMVRDVVTADIDKTFADCLRLMHSHGVRHLPVTENGLAVAVISIRDLLSEAVAHHAKVIGELELERLSMLTSTA